MKQFFLESYQEYLNQMRNHTSDFDNENNGYEVRRKQCKTLLESIKEDLNF